MHRVAPDCLLSKTETHLVHVVILVLQVPCSFPGNVIINVDSYRASGGGWVRLLFKNINGSPLDKVELAKVRITLRRWHITTLTL